MDVKCHRCAAPYHFAATAIPPTGLAVKCTHCGTLFQVHPSVGLPAAGNSPATPWLIRQVSGALFAVPDLPTLQRWIAEHRVSRDDLMATEGDNWQRLGNVAALAVCFQTPPAPAPIDDAPIRMLQHDLAQPPVLAPAPQTTAAASAWQLGRASARFGVPRTISMAPPPAYVAHAAKTLKNIPMPRLTPQPLTAGMYLPRYAGGASRVAGRRPSGSTMDAVAAQHPEPSHFGGRHGSAELMDELSGGLTRPRRGGSAWLFVALLAVSGAAGATYVLRPAWIASLVAHVRRAPVSDAALTFTEAGAALLARDSTAAIQAALESFAKASRIDNRYADAKAGMAEANLALAEVTLSAAQALEHYAAPASKKEKRHRAEQVAEERRTAATYTARALAAAKEALQLAPESQAANRALARYYFVTHAPDKASRLLERAGAAAPHDARVLYLLGLEATLHPAGAAQAEGFFQRAIAKVPDFNRARCRLAELALQRGDKALALVQVEAILRAVPEHELAQTMLATLQPLVGTKPVAPPVLPLLADVAPAPVHVVKAPQPTPVPAPIPLPAPVAPPPVPAAPAPVVPPPAPVAPKSAPPVVASPAAPLPAPTHAPRTTPPPGPKAGTTDARAASDQSLEALTQLLNHAPRSFEAHFALAEIYRSKSLKREALKHYRQALAISPDGPNAAQVRRKLEELSK